MRLPSLFRRAPSGRATDRDTVEPSFSSSRSATSSPSSDDTVATLRARARRRLIGATVLVAAAVVSLPWLFESQPRPLPADLPIEMARRDGPAVSSEDHGVGRPDAASSSPVVAGASSGDGAAPDGAAPPRVEAPSKPAAAKASHPAVASLPTPTPTSHPSAEVAPDAARALALLDGKPTTLAASSTAGARYIVQIGAYAESEAVTNARGKAEHLGFKTYTQVIDAPAGRRTRVRVGPYATKAEADHAVSQLKTAGLTAVILTL